MELNVQHNEPLGRYTTLQVGGSAEYFVQIESNAQLEEAVLYSKSNAIPITVLGGGSNVLFSDQGITGMVLRMSIMGMSAEIDESQILLTVAAGEPLDKVVKYAVKHGYWGLENLSHIPGTVGAAPVQNVGAYGVEVQDLIETVRVYNTDTNRFESLTADACHFGYRDSLFKHSEGRKYIVVAVTFLLTKKTTPRLLYTDLKNRFSDEQPTLAEIRQAIIEIRSLKFPDWKTIGTAGSFFKNPVVSRTKFEELCTTHPELPGFPSGTDSMKIPLGWILDKVLHLKGEGNDKVGTYKGQALVLVNKGTANSRDFVLFAKDITQQVFNTTGISIEWEVTKLGSENT